jgi:ABC-type thiamin/hydroxymethylpyrimidine transport system permease subunit
VIVVAGELEGLLVDDAHAALLAAVVAGLVEAVLAEDLEVVILVEGLLEHLEGVAPVLAFDMGGGAITAPHALTDGFSLL